MFALVLKVLHIIYSFSPIVLFPPNDILTLPMSLIPVINICVVYGQYSAAGVVEGQCTIAPIPIHAADSQFQIIRQRPYRHVVRGITLRGAIYGILQMYLLGASEVVVKVISHRQSVVHTIFSTCLGHPFLAYL